MGPLSGEQNQEWKLSVGSNSSVANGTSPRRPQFFHFTHLRAQAREKQIRSKAGSRHEKMPFPSLANPTHCPAVMACVVMLMCPISSGLSVIADHIDSIEGVSHTAYNYTYCYSSTYM
jgi:hypothetical protein